MKDDIEKSCTAFGYGRYLNAGEFHMSHLRFLGATLWTDFRLFSNLAFDRRMVKTKAEDAMNEYAAD